MAESPSKPVIGVILMGGMLTGALVRDVRLANELVRRGYEVHAWWAMDRIQRVQLDPSIQQHWLFNAMRFRSKTLGPLLEPLGRLFSRTMSDASRSHWLQRRPELMARIMQSLMHCVCDGVEQRRDIVSRFAASMAEARVTHMLPMLEMLGPWIQAARPRVPHPVKYLITFQGYELYSTFARAIGRERELYDRLVQAVADSDYPAIAVSEDYRLRVIDEVGVPQESLVAIPPGVPPGRSMQRQAALDLLAGKFPEFDPALPLVSFLGRRDVEKGIDLLLYAAAILRQRGQRFQLLICGPTLWGDYYGKVCNRIAEDLRCPILWRRYVPDDVRTAVFVTSRCIVYPSIHREPFGMVAAEAVAHGTPAIVPDLGGVATAIEADGTIAGMRFKAFDSGDLADQIQLLLQDDALHARLSAAGPGVAAYFSIENLGSRVLAHLGLPEHCGSPS